MNAVTERRFSATHLELRDTGGYEQYGVLCGRAAAYNKLSSDLGGFRERLAPGCFRKALAHASSQQIYLCQDHDPSKILGRVRAGNLQLEDKPDGLHFSCQLPGTTVAQDVRELVKKGILSECSFAFQVAPGGDSFDDEEFDDDEDDDEPHGRSGNGDAYANRKQRGLVRTVREILPLVDCSIVCNPAYGAGATNVSGRSFTDLFPGGLPAELRSRIPDVRERLELRTDRRRRLTNSVLSI